MLMERSTGALGNGVIFVIVNHLDNVLEWQTSSLVLDGLMNMGKPVDGLARDMGGGCHHIPVLGHAGQFICLCHRIHGRPDNGIAHNVLHALAEHVHLQVQPAQTFLILFGSHHSKTHTSFT